MAQVVTAQPGTTVIVQQTQVLRDWNSGLFSCFDDIGSCKFYLCNQQGHPKTVVLNAVKILFSLSRKLLHP